MHVVEIRSGWDIQKHRDSTSNPCADTSNTFISTFVASYASTVLQFHFELLTLHYHNVLNCCRKLNSNCPTQHITAGF